MLSLWFYPYRFDSYANASRNEISYNLFVKPFRKTQIITTELPEELQFVIQKGKGELDNIILWVLLVAFIIWAWHSQEYLFMAFVAFGLLLALINFHSGPITKLVITADGIVCVGTASRLIPKQTKLTELTFRSFEIRTLSYRSNDDQIAGLYINDATLLAALNQEDCDRICETIRTKFPLLEHPDHTPASFLYGDHSGITKLGL
jgi:uncharacterized membrane protein YccF (DUF307 family)